MTAQLYVLGHPVGHSKSPAMHNAAIAALGLDWRYDLMDCATVEQARAFVDGGEWLALNITMPYKPLALECAQKPSVAARLAGGANVLVDAGGVLHADNVDGKGCVSYLRRCGFSFEGARVVVCGTGPTSCSIMHACVQAGSGRVSLLGRDSARSAAVVDRYLAMLADGESGDPSQVNLRSGCYADGLGIIAEADLIIDATPLGMNPGDPAPFDVSALNGGQTVLDVVYGHGTTALAQAAQTAGCPFFDGSGMLVAQAVETVHVIAGLTGLFDVPQDVDLFAIMAQAAGMVPE